MKEKKVTCIDCRWCFYDDQSMSWTCMKKNVDDSQCLDVRKYRECGSFSPLSFQQVIVGLYDAIFKTMEGITDGDCNPDNAELLQLLSALERALDIVMHTRDQTIREEIRLRESRVRIPKTEEK